MGRVLKISDLSKKDYSLETGILRVKDSVFNITSDVGDGSKADFNESNPLLYWSSPINPKKGAVAHVLFNDGLAYYTYDGILWSLNFFYPSSAYIPSGHQRYKALLTQTGNNDPTATVVENTLGTVNLVYDGIGSYLLTSSSLFTSGKTGVLIGINPINTSIFYEDILPSTIALGSTVNGVRTDGTLTNHLIIIEVYP